MDLPIFFFVSGLAILLSYISLTRPRQVQRVLYGVFAMFLFLGLAALMHSEGYRIVTGFDLNTGDLVFTSYSAANSLSGLLLSYGFFAMFVVFLISNLSDFLNWKGDNQ